MSKSASIWSRLAIFRLPRSAEKGQHFQTGGEKTGAKAQPRYNGFRVISDRVITALQCSFCTAKATHIFSAKKFRILYIESTKTVKEMTLNKLVKLTTL